MDSKRYLHRFVDVIGESPAAERVAQPIQQWSNDAYAMLGSIGKPIGQLLRGEWLGHPLHPLLTDIPIGAWTSATMFDFLGIASQSSRHAADVSLAAGLVSAPVVAAAGHADWMQTNGRARRIGLAHGTLNSIAFLVYAMSAWHRVRGHRTKGVLFGLVGMSIATVAGYLGGSLIFREGVGVESERDRTGE